MANYTLRADGTAANLAAALDGDPTVASECLSLAGYASYGAGASPGDHFQLADDGGDYRGTLSIKESGTSGDRYVYEAYSGDTPVINGSDLVATWSDEGSDIWSATLTTEPNQAWMDGTYGDRQVDLISCVNEYDWFWESNVLYVFAASDPDTRYTSPGVETDIRSRCINTEAKEYLTFDGITCSKSTSLGLFLNRGSGLEVKNCIGEWCWGDGIRYALGVGFTGSDITIEDSIGRYCGVGGISFTVSASGVLSNVIVRRNTTYENGRHQYANPLWTGDHTYTSGIKLWAANLHSSNVAVYENKSYSNGAVATILNSSQKGVGIWIDEMEGESGDPISVHHNLCYDNHGSGIFLENTSWNDVYGNLIYDCATGSNANTPYVAGGIKVMCRSTYDSKSNVVVNNTVYNSYIGIHAATFEESGDLEFDDNTFKNNILAGCTYAIRTEDGAANDTWGTGNVYENNCCGAEASNFIMWNTTAHSTYDAWIAASSQTDNNIEADPSFTNAGADDYTLAAGSPCIGAAENLGSPYDAALLAASSWPDSVVTGSQDDY